MEIHCEFCEPDGAGRHAPRCPVELEKRIDAMVKVAEKRAKEIHGLREALQGALATVEAYCGTKAQAGSNLGKWREAISQTPDFSSQFVKREVLEKCIGALESAGYAVLAGEARAELERTKS